MIIEQLILSDLLYNFTSYIVQFHFLEGRKIISIRNDAERNINNFLTSARLLSNSVEDFINALESILFYSHAL